MRVFLFVTSIVAAFVARQAWADDVESNLTCRTKTGKTCVFDIKIQGKITSATLEELKKAFAERDQIKAREGVEGYFFGMTIDSPGGSVNAAIEIGRLLRLVDAPIAVDAEQLCVSARVLVLAGATERSLRGRIGIHRPYLETPTRDVNVGEVQTLYDKMTEQIRAYLKGMNVSDKLADDMMIVPPENIRFLSANELVNYGLGSIDPVKKEARELNEARKRGIDRAEYMRRKARSETNCKITEQSAAGTIRYQDCVDDVLSGKR
jgi:ATP-dependent protease ClpP protease subunit